MKTYYLYILAGREIDCTTSFYKVSIGTSVQDARDLRTIMIHAKQRNHYFAIWSHEVDLFLDDIKKSLQLSQLPMQWISGRDLCKLMKDAVTNPLDRAALRTADNQSKMLNLDYRVSSNLNRRKACSC